MNFMPLQQMLHHQGNDLFERISLFKPYLQCVMSHLISSPSLCGLIIYPTRNISVGDGSFFSIIHKLVQLPGSFLRSIRINYRRRDYARS
jgi:hypothetical protein